MKISRFTHSALFLAMFISQILDGVLTYLGVVRYSSIDVEGNFIIHTLMGWIGAAPALILTKIVACIIILIVYNRTKESISRSVIALLVVVLLLYCYAIAAWSYLLFLK